MADFKIGDKVRIIGDIEKQNIGKEGTIIKDGGFSNVGFRELNKGFNNNKEEEMHLWIIALDVTDETIILPEADIEKIS